MKTKQQILEILASCKPELEHRFQIRSIALFGSYARGEQTDDSDIDILVDVGPEIGLDFVTLADQVEHILGVPVEMVSLRALKPRFYQRIKGDLVYV